MTGNHAGVERVLAEIVDDGCGFELREAMTEGLDLLRKAERMAALGGKFVVTTALPVAHTSRQRYPCGRCA